jgi:hypothetical protein
MFRLMSRRSDRGRVDAVSRAVDAGNQRRRGGLALTSILLAV